MKPVFEDQDEAWVDLHETWGAARPGESFHWIKGRKAFLWLSERDGWRRAWSVPLDNAAKPEPVTPGGMDVIDLVAVDAESRWLYYVRRPRMRRGVISIDRRSGSSDLPNGSHRRRRS